MLLKVKRKKPGEAATSTEQKNKTNELYHKEGKSQMENIIKLVLVKHDSSTKVYLFQAGKYDLIYNGDLVVCETKYGKSYGRVVGVEDCFEDSPFYKFAVIASGATLPLKKVLGKYVMFDRGKNQDERN